MKYLVSAAIASLAMVAAAHAAPMTIGGVNFDSSNTPIDVKIAQGGHFVGPPSGWRNVGDDVPEVEGFDLDTSFELDSNGTSPDDVLSLLFASPLANGGGACTASADPKTGPASAAATWVRARALASGATASSRSRNTSSAGRPLAFSIIFRLLPGTERQVLRGR